jgi:outer membrane protein assembly factor BamB
MSMLHTRAVFLLSLAASVLAGQPTQKQDWPVWGGLNRDFIVATSGLANSWPAQGPKKLWSRPLGDGYSAIAEENGVLYTAFHGRLRDVVTALDAGTGKTIWEYWYVNTFTNVYPDQVGPGPYAMPQVISGRVVVASGTGKIQSLDQKTGRLVWSHDLYSEFHGTPLEYGYTSHPLPYRDMLICLSGGNGDAAIAFRQSDGKVVWKALQFTNSQSSPLLINVDGQPQVVAVGARSVFGFHPDTGALLWAADHTTPYGLAISTPVWAPGNLLFVASAYGVGAKVFQLASPAAKPRPKSCGAILAWSFTSERRYSATDICTCRRDTTDRF